MNGVRSPTCFQVRLCVICYVELRQLDVVIRPIDDDSSVVGSRGGYSVVVICVYLFYQ
jgi:hypothetical protein